MSFCIAHPKPGSAVRAERENLTEHILNSKGSLLGITDEKNSWNSVLRFADEKWTLVGFKLPPGLKGPDCASEDATLMREPKSSMDSIACGCSWPLNASVIFERTYAAKSASFDPTSEAARNNEHIALCFGSWKLAADQWGKAHGRVTRAMDWSMKGRNQRFSE